MLKFLRNLLLAITVATSLLSAQALRFPTNVRFIAGGYINKSPYFNTLNAALNDVKPFATSSNPYTFWIDGDTTFIADWDSVYNQGLNMKDSINFYYVSVGKIKWGGFGFGGGGSGSSTPILSPTLETLHYNFPKWDPVTAAVWQDSLSQALDSIDHQIWNMVVYTGRYLSIVNDTLAIDTTGLAASFGITAGKVSADTTHFVGTDTLESVSVPGGTPSDSYILQPQLNYTTDPVNANDLLYVIPITNGFWMKRHAGGTANLKVIWIKKTR